MARLARLSARWRTLMTGERGARLRYLVAGGLNTLVGNAIYPFLVWSSGWFAKRYMIALVVAQAASLVFAYGNYKLTVFRTRGNVAREFAKFSAFYLPLFALNYATLPFLVEVMRVDRILAQVGFGALVVVASYVWNRRVTFRRRP